MENLVSSARAAMNIILLSTLLISWGIFRDSPNVIQIGLNIYALSEKSVKPARKSELKLFLDKMAVSISEGKSPKEAIGEIKVSEILSIANENYLTLFGIRKEPTTSEQRDLLNKMEEDLATLTDIDQLKTRIKPSISLLLSADGKRFQSNIAEIELLFKEAKLSESATINDLHSKTSLQIRIPLIDEPIQAEIGIIIIGLGLFGPYIYLFSVCKALTHECTFLTERKGIDWLFFHPAKIGLGLSVLWLLSPAIVLFAAIALGKFQIVFGMLLLISMVVMAYWNIKAGIIARQAFHNRLLVIEKERESRGESGVEP